MVAVDRGLTISCVYGFAPHVHAHVREENPLFPTRPGKLLGQTNTLGDVYVGCKRRYSIGMPLMDMGKLACAIERGEKIPSHLLRGGGGVRVR